MTELANMRKQRRWTQAQVAERLGVSQTLVSLWETGRRRTPSKHLEELRQLGFAPDPLELPWREDKPEYARELANLGYPGFAHLRTDTAHFNPAQVLVLALAEPVLERRVAEALPWVAARYADLDWNRVLREAKLRGLQNRLGFAVAVATRLAQVKGRLDSLPLLDEVATQLQDQVLYKVDTFCNERMTSAERKWLENRRPEHAVRWRVLSDLDVSQLTHAEL
jgi:transcriptional regulator with XRE-family HTH domain